MRKVISVSILFLIFICTKIVPVYAFPIYYDGKEEEYTGTVFDLVVNGEKAETEVPPVILFDRCFVPARAIFEKADAKVEWDGNARKVIVARNDKNIEMTIDSNEALVNGSKVTMEQPAKIINDRTMVPVRFVGETLGMNVGWHPERGQITLDYAEFKGVKYSRTGARDSITLSVDRLNQYKVFSLKGPDRVVIDIFSAITTSSEKKLELSSSLLGSVRHSQWNDSTVRVVLDAKVPVKYETEASGNELKIYVSAENPDLAVNQPGDTQTGGTQPVTPSPTPSPKPSPTPPQPGASPGYIHGTMAKPVNIGTPFYPGIQYYNSQDRVHLIIKGINLTDGERLNKLFLSITDPKIAMNYTEYWDPLSKKFTLTFSNKGLSLGNRVMKVNDSYLHQIEFKEDRAAQKNNVIFSAKGDYKFEVYGHSRENETAITIVKPRPKSDRLVVIGAGHGGSDPGAVYKDEVYEKTVNLDIAFRLNALLKAKKINTYMLREDDRFVGLYERAAIANDLNAEFFISLHNNWMGSPDVKGTLTICHPTRQNPNGFGSKRLAQIVQEKMVKALGTTDLKLLQDADYVEVKATAMPAVISEISFLSSTVDRQNLLNPAYRQKAAQALCDAILQAMEENK